MKKLINSVDDVLTESLRGFEAACGDVVRLHRDPVFLTRAAPAPDGKVALVSGGGSGHEPLHGGFVGMGMLDAACPGQVFTSPTPDQMLAAAQAVDRGAGTLFIVKNYSGDVMNFEMAAEMYEGTSATVLTNDDVAVEDSTYTTGRRGRRRHAGGGEGGGGGGRSRCGPGGVPRPRRAGSTSVPPRWAWRSRAAPCRKRGGRPSTSTTTRWRWGVGIHGEPGRKRLPMASADGIASQLVEPILNDLSPADGDRALLLVNGFGASPLMELTLMYDAARRAMASSGVEVVRSLVGNYVTSLDMAGCSITLSMMDDETLSLWDAPVHTAALRWGVLKGGRRARLGRRRGGLLHERSPGYLGRSPLQRHPGHHPAVAGEVVDRRASITRRPSGWTARSPGSWFAASGLAHKFHRIPAAGADMIKPTLAAQAFCAFAALNAARVLDVLASTPARPDSRSPCQSHSLRSKREPGHLHALASGFGEICELALTAQPAPASPDISPASPGGGPGAHDGAGFRAHPVPDGPATRSPHRMRATARRR